MESKYSTMRCRVVGCMTASCQGRILKKKKLLFSMTYMLYGNYLRTKGHVPGTQSPI